MNKILLMFIMLFNISLSNIPITFQNYDQHIFESKNAVYSIYCEGANKYSLYKSNKLNGDLSRELYNRELQIILGHIYSKGAAVKKLYPKEIVKMSKNEELIKQYINDGKKYLIKGKEEEWEKVVPIRVNDLYGGIEIVNTIEILKEYVDNNDPVAAKKVFDKAGHSGMSAGLVFSILSQLMENGDEIVKVIK